MFSCCVVVRVFFICVVLSGIVHCSVLGFISSHLQLVVVVVVVLYLKSFIVLFVFYPIVGARRWRCLLYVLFCCQRQSLRDKSVFKSPAEVKRGLGPAGAFAGNANWRVDMARCFLCDAVLGWVALWWNALFLLGYVVYVCVVL